MGFVSRGCDYGGTDSILIVILTPLKATFIRPGELNVHSLTSSPAEENNFMAKIQPFENDLFQHNKSFKEKVFLVLKSSHRMNSRPFYNKLLIYLRIKY